MCVMNCRNHTVSKARHSQLAGSHSFPATAKYGFTIHHMLFSIQILKTCSNIELHSHKQAVAEEKCFVLYFRFFTLHPG